MRVYISVDIEGVAGVVTSGQGDRRASGHDYGIARELMTHEANAAALGAFDAGADEVVINDSHGDMENLLIDKLDPRVRLISGGLKPLSMVEGVQDGRYDVGLLVGYHASAGTLGGVIAHTYSGRVAHIKVNGRVMNEASLNALMAGHHGVPVGMVTGDEACCRECRRLLGRVGTVPVKKGISRGAAKSLHPEESRRRIRATARKTVENASRFKPYRMRAPYRLEVRFHKPGMADAASILPGADRADGVSLRYKARTVPELFKAMLCFVGLGSFGA